MHQSKLFFEYPAMIHCWQRVSGFKREPRVAPGIALLTIRTLLGINALLTIRTLLGINALHTINLALDAGDLLWYEARLLIFFSILIQRSVNGDRYLLVCAKQALSC